MKIWYDGEWMDGGWMFDGHGMAATVRLASPVMQERVDVQIEVRALAKSRNGRGSGANHPANRAD